ncbi:Hypothetical Protein RradSPS_2330 [Rubrobacter radiotolerans]|uniref:Uncharacterized protein n=1 Tax=Rubrobacter radiotolerans TaxID=42256 RepID=A0A023X5M4_RUBRA|nr:hypothetical protein [Rubrobacter radiotolerans]AHY47613.1 Hypothetical Protein RradSPS_2330 [Rubrobacter radiotolerans]MDX5895018.1 hypothetical protein [Rubrobacter radiotolerans]SMC07283.1 hypothetical protein SAMN00767673_2333 [Rubrobacter radiotolerans DSM 5868]
MKTTTTARTTETRTGRSRPAGLVAALLLLCGLAGGVLWALSPLGVALSEFAFRTPNVFWRLFFTAPALMVFGLLGLYLALRREIGRAGTVGVALAGLGGLAVVAGDLGLYHLGLDDLYLISAPAYRTFRAGLLALCLGCLVLGAASASDRRLPLWAFLPLAVGALAGLISVLRDFGAIGAAMWVFFGASFSLCCAVVLVGVLRDRGRSGKNPKNTPAPDEPSR